MTTVVTVTDDCFHFNGNEGQWISKCSAVNQNISGTCWCLEHPVLCGTIVDSHCKNKQQHQQVDRHDNCIICRVSAILFIKCSLKMKMLKTFFTWNVVMETEQKTNKKSIYYLFGQNSYFLVWKSNWKNGPVLNINRCVRKGWAWTTLFKVNIRWMHRVMN